VHAAAKVPRPYVLEENLGVLRPGEVRSHVFTVRNESAFRWTFARAERTCSCMATQISMRVIEPGAEEKVEVVYRAPSTSREDFKTIRLHFEEKAAPVFELNLRAQIREAMLLSPVLVDFHRNMNYSRTNSTIHVHNFADSDWRSIAITNQVDWLSVQIVPIPPPGDNGDSRLPRQSWRVLLNANPDSLPIGRHKFELRVESQGGPNSHSALLPVQIEIEPLVSIVPSEVFFDATAGGAPDSKTLLLRFSNGVIPSRLSDVVLRHDLGDQLRLSWQESDGAYWKLGADFVPSGAGEYVEGSLTIEFRDSEMRTRTVPIRAIVRFP
jgi:Protein of unknown function (DUF1573)